MAVEVSLNGLGAAADAVDRALAIIVTNAANDIAANAQDLAPVDTGNLKGSILPDTSEAETSHRSAVDVGAEYGRAVEEGHETKAGSFVAAQPYMAPAVAAVTAALPEVGAAVLRAEMSK